LKKEICIKIKLIIPARWRRRRHGDIADSGDYWMWERYKIRLKDVQVTYETFVS